MTCQSAPALRTALERRLSTRSAETGVSLDRLRRRAMFERIIARIQAAEPGQWTRKGGMAVDVRLRDDSGGVPTWRAEVSTQLADKPFGGIQLDVSPRTHELHATNRLAIPSSLAFAGVPTVEVEAVDTHRHAAEKFHGMLRDFGEREHSRVRDLVDLAILLEHYLLEPVRTAAAVRSVWREHNNTEPPGDLRRLPESWPDRYQRLAASHGIGIPPYVVAMAAVTQLWRTMLPRVGTQ